jgi:hypothetical protein
VELPYIEYVSNETFLKALDLNFGYNPKDKKITKDVFAGEKGIDGWLDKLEYFVEKGDNERLAYKVKADIVKEFCYVDTPKKYMRHFSRFMTVLLVLYCGMSLVAT